MKMDNSFRTQTTARLAVIEKSILLLGDGMNDLKGTVVNLRDNHLHDLGEKLTDLDIKINSNPTWLITFIITALSSLLTAVIITLLRG